METPEAQQPTPEELSQDKAHAKPRKPRKPRRQKAVIDRIEEGKWAVLLVGRKEVEKIVALEELPKEAKAGTWLKLRMMEEGVRDVIVDEEATAAARGRVESKMDLLRSRKSQLKPISAAEAQSGAGGSKLRRLSPVSGETSGTPPQNEPPVDEGAA